MGIAIHKVVRRSDYASPFNASQLNFTHGVASGDPYPDSVILWTRCSPEYDDDRSNVTVSGTVPLYDHSSDRYVSVSVAPVCVEWQISTSPNMTSPVNSGRVYTSSDIDYTVKVKNTPTSRNSSAHTIRSRPENCSRSLNTTIDLLFAIRLITVQ